MDLIRRKDAVSRISDLLILELKGQRLPTWNEVYNAIGDIPSVPAVPMEIDETPTVGEWVSVKDRLPESGKHVLVCCEIHPYNHSGMMPERYICDGYYAAAHSIADAYDSDYYDAYDYDEEDDNYYLKEGWYEVIKNWDEYDSVVIEDFVTHWMPLPEPPKEE